MPKRTLLFFLSFTSLISIVHAQDSTSFDKIISFPDKLFASIDKKTRKTEAKLEDQTAKYLARFQKQEEKLKRKLWKKDSLLAQQLFPSDLNTKYQQLRNAPIVNKYSSVYSGHLDSLSTALRFLNTNSLPAANAKQVQLLLEQQKGLQEKLNTSDQVQKFLSQRRQLLKEQLQKVGLIKELNKYRKQVYYYQQQIKEYKDAFEDPDKLEKKLMKVAMQFPSFKEFFARNSTLGSLFALPGSSQGGTASVAGLQTRASLNQLFADRFGTGANVNQVLQQNMQAAQGQLNDLKNRASQFTSGTFGNSSTDVDLPQGFKPNSQKTRSFLKRLELGGNIQSQKAKLFFPVTSDIGFSVGYKLNDKSVIGVGGSGKIGWGTGWNNIQMTYQGISARSYLDYKIKGSFYLSGGYEMNYRSLIRTVQQLQDYSAWQHSGLIGLSKRYQVNKKIKGEMKVLWDFMSYEQVPRAQPLLFRIGYSLK
ncbi:MAG: hypothetical protein ACM3VS_03180 [Candidatus Dadabacteria bacterium]